MRLLITTQKVDKNDYVLGFFHNWLLKLAPHFKDVHVIALSVGEYDLPENVHVYSLGKEKTKKTNTLIYQSIFDRAVYVFRFVRYIVQIRGRYDVVFSHMNPEYIVLAGIYWRLSGKRVALWYNHKIGSAWMRIASVFAHRIFYVSKFAFASKYKKAMIMPAGIDTDLFVDKNMRREEGSVISLGRISPVKEMGEILEGFQNMGEKLSQAYVYGAPTDADTAYFGALKEQFSDMESDGELSFMGSVLPSEAPDIYNKHELLVNATPSGSFDKVIPEAMASGMLVLVSNKSFEGILPEAMVYEQGDISDLVRKATSLLALSESEKENQRERLREIVEENHSLKKLVSNLVGDFKNE